MQTTLMAVHAHATQTRPLLLHNDAINEERLSAMLPHQLSAQLPRADGAAARPEAF